MEEASIRSIDFTMLFVASLYSRKLGGLLMCLMSLDVFIDLKNRYMCGISFVKYSMYSDCTGSENTVLSMLFLRVALKSTSFALSAIMLTILIYCVVDCAIELLHSPNSTSAIKSIVFLILIHDIFINALFRYIQREYIKLIKSI